jgi:fatty-acyl-CoA synthase
LLHLTVKPWANCKLEVLSHQFVFQNHNQENFTTDGWFKTGDVSTIDPDGYMEIKDRTKDLIKSGGEWISSVALESALMAPQHSRSSSNSHT